MSKVIMYWVNGIYWEKLSLVDRICFFGDGFFTTARLRNGIIELLDSHIDRLVIAGKQLLFDNLDIATLRQELAIVLKCGKNGVIKIIIVRERSGEDGYSFKRNVEPLRIIHFFSVKKDYKDWRKNGVRLIRSAVRLSRNPLLAGIKHLNRLEQIMIRENLFHQSDAEEALVLDTEGNIVECCAANIFWRIGCNVFTPSLKYAGVSGVMRGWVLQLLPKLGYNVQEIITAPDILEQAEEVFISNSLLPLVSVVSVEKYRYTNRTLCGLLCSYYADL